MTFCICSWVSFSCRYLKQSVPCHSTENKQIGLLKPSFFLKQTAIHTQVGILEQFLLHKRTQRRRLADASFSTLR